MTFAAITSTSMIWCFLVGQSTEGPSTTSTALEQMATLTLDGSTTRQSVKWELDGNFSATMNVTVSANGALQQSEGVRVAVYKSDGTPVEGGEVFPGSSRSFSFNLSTGTYYVLFDLGLEDSNSPIVGLNVLVEGRLTDLATGNIIHIRPQNGDLPPDPCYPPPSQIYLPGPFPMPAADFIPTRRWQTPRLETMTYLVDWA